MALWKDRLEDDGAANASEASLRRIADAVVSDALQGLRRAVAGEDLTGQWRAQLLLELARLLRLDLHAGAWGRLGALDRIQLRRALLVLGVLARARTPVPVA